MKPIEHGSMSSGMSGFEMSPVHHDEHLPVRPGDSESPAFASFKTESASASPAGIGEGLKSAEDGIDNGEDANIAAARAFLASMMRTGKKPPEEVFKDALKKDHGEKISDTAKAAIRENMTHAVAETGGTISAALALPEEYIPGTEALRGKRIVMADDEVNAVLQSIVHGSVATDGNFDVVLQKDASDTADRLADRIIEKNPDLVLVDFDFSFSVTGDMVVRALREKGYSGRIIGSSQRSDNAEAFLRVGVINSYDKRFKLGPEEEMRGLAAAFEH